MDLAQELLINVQCSSISTSYAKETRALKMRSTAVSYRKLTTSRIIEADPLTTTWEVAEELSVDHSTVVQHLKQTGKAKKLNKWMPHEFTKKKKKIFVLKCYLLLFYATTMNHFLIKLWCAIKSGFSMIITNDQLSVWTKKLQSTCQSQTCTKKGHRSLLGGFLLEWSTTAFWISVKPLHLRSMLKNWWDALKTEMPEAGIGQQ